MHAGCRHSMKERRSLNSKSRVVIMLPGDLTSTPSGNTHLLQGLGMIWSQFSLLQEATGLSTGSSVFLQETSCRIFGRPRTDCVEEFEARSPIRRHATNVFLHHPLLSPPSTTPIAMQWKYLHSQIRTLNSQRKQFSDGIKDAEAPCATYQSHLRTL